MTCGNNPLNLFVESDPILCTAPTCNSSSTAPNAFTLVLRED